MRGILLLLVASLGSAAAPASAQDRDTFPAPGVRAAIAHAYHGSQGRNRGPERTERFSRKVKIGRDGRVSIQNISGDITVTGGSGDEVSIEAVKRARGDSSQLERARIVVDERAGRVDI